MAPPIKLTADKLRDIEKNLYYGKGIQWACKQAGIRYSTYLVSRWRCYKGEGPQWQRPHFVLHEAVRDALAAEQEAEAPFKVREMALEAKDWRGVKEAAAMVRERQRAQAAQSSGVDASLLNDLLASLKAEANASSDA